MQSIETLKRHLRRGSPGLALDIDETIADTAFCWFETMLAKFGNPEQCGARDMIAKYRYTENVPYWQDAHIMDWLESMRYNSDFQATIPPIKEALESIHEVCAVLPVRIYLSARPQQMLSCTETWLAKHGFPGAPIVLRPQGLRFEASAAWKARTLSFLYPEVVGIIDDNAGVLEHLPDTYRGKVYLYSHQSSPVRHVHAHPCPTWRDIRELVIAHT